MVGVKSVMTMFSGSHSNSDADNHVDEDEK